MESQVGAMHKACHILPCHSISARTSRHCLHSGIDGLLQAVGRHRARLCIRGPDDAAVAHSHLCASIRELSGLPLQLVIRHCRFPMLRVLCLSMTAAIGIATVRNGCSIGRFGLRLHTRTRTLLALVNCKHRIAPKHAGLARKQLPHGLAALGPASAGPAPLSLTPIASAEAGALRQLARGRAGTLRCALPTPNPLAGAHALSWREGQVIIQRAPLGPAQPPNSFAGGIRIRV